MRLKASLRSGPNMNINNTAANLAFASQRNQQSIMED